MHHVRYRQRHEGVVGLELALGSIIAAMPMVVNELEEATQQMLVRITAVDPIRRYVLTDPRTAPRRRTGRASEKQSYPRAVTGVCGCTSGSPNAANRPGSRNDTTRAMPAPAMVST